MFDWLTATGALDDSLTWDRLAMRLALAILFGSLVAAAYCWKRAPQPIAPNLPVTLVLLSVLIAMVTQVVGDHIARAFSLVGALSIVRFRTVVEDTQDIAFVIFAVVVGMALGAGDIAVASIGTVAAMSVIAGAKAISTRWGKASNVMPIPAITQSELQIRTSAHGEFANTIHRMLAELNIPYAVHGVESVRGGSAYDWTIVLHASYSHELQSMVDGLARTDGVQSVQWKART
ncbi:MAG: DUF4956 domain-containing protein [Pirellula sp.]